MSSVGLTVGCVFLCVVICRDKSPFVPPSNRLTATSSNVISSPCQSLFRSRLLAFFESSCGVTLQYFDQKASGSVVTMFAGKRPVLTEGFGVCLSVLPSVSLQALDTSPLLRISSSPILQPPIFIEPVPYFSTLSHTVPSNGLRTTIIGSCAGFSAVPHPSHFFASSVAGVVISIVVVFVDQSSVVSFDIIEPL